MNNEKQILIKVQNKDKYAFRELFDLYQHKIYNYTLSLIRNKDDSLDIVQNVFKNVWLKINRYNLEKEFSPWIYKITTNMCKDYWRKNSRKNANELLIEPEKIGYNSIGSYMEFTSNDIISIVNILPKKQKLIYILRDLQELSISDVSSILSISKSSVKTNLFHARKALQLHLTKFNQDE